jgi:polysaccharide export outer membrane protein
MLPAAAPTTTELLTSAGGETPAAFNYSVIPLDARIVAILNRHRPTLTSKFKGGAYRATNSLTPGDVVAITVYETGGQTLFPPPAVVPGASGASSPLGAVATGASNIPPQVIEADGTIFVPFVGRVRVQGLTPGQTGALIADRLQGKAVSPQVMVSLVNNLGNSATVGGDVNSPRAVPLGSRGERLLDVIAAAGGSKFPAYATYVQIVRNRAVGNVLLQRIIDTPAENIVVQPRDQIYVVHNPRTFSVMGATKTVNVYPFNKENVTLAEAIAQGGGPIDGLGNPSGIYLFRFEPLEIAREVLGPAIQSYEPNPPDFVPIIYSVDLRDARGYFVTQATDMRDKDIVLVSNAEISQLQKMLAVADRVAGIAYDYARIRDLSRR